MYGTAFLGFNLVQWWYKQPFHDIPEHVFARLKPTWANVAIMIAAFVVVIAYAFSRGVSIGLTIDRGQRGYLNTQLWVVLIFVVNGLAMFMFAGWSNLTRVAKIAVISSVIVFVGFQLAMGNRRDFLPMFVFIACVVANKRHMIIRWGTLLIGSVAFVIFMAIGIVRQVLQDPAILARFNAIELVITQNEFVAPIYTLMHYVNHFRVPRWGLTYLAAPSQLIPRAIYPDKPESLSLQFMRDAFGSTGLMGYAYTPVTEAFLNFSWVGPFLVFALWSLVLVKMVRSADAHPAWYLLAYALVIDFHRGDFAGTFYAVFFVGGSYAVMQFVSHLTWSSRDPTGSQVVGVAPVLHSR
jgi:oligosaccharide repeat unit polymerase